MVCADVLVVNMHKERHLVYIDELVCADDVTIANVSLRSYIALFVNISITYVDKKAII